MSLSSNKFMSSPRRRGSKTIKSLTEDDDSTVNSSLSSSLSLNNFMSSPRRRGSKTIKLLTEDDDSTVNSSLSSSNHSTHSSSLVEGLLSIGRRAKSEDRRRSKSAGRTKSVTGGGSRHARARLRPRKCVSFDIGKTEEHESPELPEEELLARWYTSDECQTMKNANQFVIKMIHRASETKGSSPDLYLSTLSECYQICRKRALTPEEQKNLTRQIQTYESRCGLEVKLFGKTASRHKDRRRAVLIDVCTTLGQKHPELSKDALAERMRQCCSQASRPARHLAQAVGQAHHAASTAKS